MKFKQVFTYLTGNAPYDWQEKLYQLFCSGEIPCQISLPTGSGKTQIITCWLLARSENDNLPRRLVYVVDRRSAVDQSTKVVDDLVAKLQTADKDLPVGNLLSKMTEGLGVSTLRGEYVDNQAWSTVPHRPSIVCGTVDMVGSRLLFSGYGDGPYSRALHAALLGNDTMIVFDECHLVPTFATLLKNIENAGGKLKPFHYVLMSATSDAEGLSLTEADLTNATFRQRFYAKKTIEVVKSAQIEKSIVSLAKTTPPKRTIIFVESPSTAVRIAEQLPGTIVTLTGTMRGKERDDLVDNPLFQAFTKAEEPAATHYLVATSAGEVGIDLTCARLITDVTTAHSLVQRFGRCARFGECDGQIYVVTSDNSTEKTIFDDGLKFLSALEGDGSCANLWGKREELAHLTHAPDAIPTLEARILDILAMTSLHNEVTVDEYLRGQQQKEHYVNIAFRQEAGLLAEMGNSDFDYYIKYFPVLSFEKLSEKASRIHEVAKQVINERANLKCTVILPNGEKKGLLLSELSDSLRNCLLILPETSGFGLRSGMLIRSDGEDSLDISTIEHKHHMARSRYILPADTEYVPASGEIVVFDRQLADKRIVIVRPKQPKDYGTESLCRHGDRVSRVAKVFAEKAGLDQELIAFLAEAGQFHDADKASPVWQLAARGGSIKNPIAKTWYLSTSKLAGFRHEFGSMDKVAEDITKHLIAAHHAGARPTWIGTRHLSPVLQDGTKVYTQILRYATLQKKFGWWGLAYLEAILRAADAYASCEASK